MIKIMITHLCRCAPAEIRVTMQLWLVSALASALQLAPAKRFAARHAPARCTILEEILQEAKLVRGGGGLVEQPVFFDGEVDGPFDLERWQQHRSSSRYARLIPGILLGATTQRIASTVAALVTFSAAVGVYNQLALDPSLGFTLPPVQLPLTPFTLTSPILGLLLVFRTDAANTRFNVATDALWEITSAHRCIIRKLVAWSGRDHTSNAERLAALEIIDGCLLLHGWIVGSFLRGRPLKATQEAQLLRFAAGREDIIAIEGANMVKTPYLAITALSLGACRRLPSLGVGEQLSLEEDFGAITKSLGKCERLLRAPIPLGYTRYSVRFLWLWLSLLPFALENIFADTTYVGTWWADKPQPALALAMLFISFVFLSIEDIAVQIEEPFSVLPLVKCHKWLQVDVRRIVQLVMRDLDISQIADDA